jgi:nitroimidazol reductase NimA-like FMN-containing flavoprotein (pyridoxamine 5'-phosphate oxidase superfamily)
VRLDESDRVAKENMMATEQKAEAVGHLDELTYEECVRRLASKEIGHLVVVDRHYPHVFPVNYRLDDDVVVFRSNYGTKLLAAHHENVAFYVDHIDESRHSGWSVQVHGMAEDITDHVEDPLRSRAEKLDPKPWAPGEKSRLVRIIPRGITGRVLTPSEVGFWSDPRGYL